MLSTRRLDRVLEHEAGDLTATVEAGIRLSALAARLAEAGQMLALDPPGDPTVGACVAANLSGPRRHRYGAPRDLVLGVTAVLADGTIAQLGRQGREERRGLRPLEALLRLGGHARADRARQRPPAPASAGRADARRRRRAAPPTRPGSPSRSGSRRSSRARSTCSGAPAAAPGSCSCSRAPPRERPPSSPPRASCSAARKRTRPSGRRRARGSPGPGVASRSRRATSSRCSGPGGGARPPGVGSAYVPEPAPDPSDPAALALAERVRAAFDPRGTWA